MSYDLWGRLRYMLSPQLDIYEKVAEVVRGNVADIGCGSGFGTHMLRRNADLVIGYEVDEKALQFAERVFTNHCIKFIRADITQESHFKHLFDYVTMIDVIEHLVEDELAAKNCKRLLASGGKFICSTPNRLSRYRMSEYHVKEYSPKELETMLGDVFSTVDIVDHTLNPITTDYANPLIAICE